MAEYQHKPDQGPGAEKQFLIYMAVAFLMVALFQGLFKPAQPPRQAATPAASTPAPPAAQPVPTGKQPVPAAKKAESETEIVVESDLYRVTLTNRGALVKSWIVKKYLDEKGQPLDLVNQKASAQMGLPLSLWPYDETLRSRLNTALYQASSSGPHIHIPSTRGASAEISFEYSDGGVSASKKLVFDDSYVIRLETSVTQNGTWVQAFPAWPSALGDEWGPATYATSRLDWHTPNSIERRPALERNIIRSNRWVSNGETVREIINWAGVTDQFFGAIFLPDQPRSAAIITLHEQMEVAKDPADANNKELTKVSVLGIAAGDARGPSKGRLFVGPKEMDVLESVHSDSDEGFPGGGPNLAGTIDFGFFGIFARWLFLWLNWTHDHWVANWGWSIVILTVIINLALLPTRISMMRTSLKMQKAQPQLNAIQKKYEKYSMRDQEKMAQKQQEMSAVWKEHGVNPAGGCLPMLLQLPLLYAFYAVLANTIELRQAHWLWIKDLSAPDPLHLLPILTIITMVSVQQMTPQPGVDPAQRRMMNVVMPIMFAGFTWAVAAGLALYWTVGSIVGIIIQMVMNRTPIGREIRELQMKRARKQQK